MFNTVVAVVFSKKLGLTYKKLGTVLYFRTEIAIFVPKKRTLWTNWVRKSPKNSDKAGAPHAPRLCHYFWGCVPDFEAVYLAGLGAGTVIFL